MPIATVLIGVRDEVGTHPLVKEILAVGTGGASPLGASVQATTIIPVGDLWQIKGSLSHTPTIITDTFPPSPILAWKVPSGKALLFGGGIAHGLAAATDYVRVCRRYFMFGYQATAAPAAPAVPTTALVAMTAGIAGAGAYTWKVAPLDTFRRESAATAASTPALTLTATNRGASVTPPALPTGAIGYNIYRTLAGGATYYFVGSTIGATAYTDAQPDSAIDPAQNGGVDRQPNATWVTGDVVGETADGPVELIIEVGAVALTGAPTALVYTGGYGEQQQFFAVTFPTTVGQRIRAKLYGETANFVAVPVVAGGANLWRGLHSSDARTRFPHDLGATKVAGVNAVPSAGSYIVWGQQVIGSQERIEAAAAIKANRIIPTDPDGVLIPALGEIVVEIGALAAGVASVRDVSLQGLLIPTT